MRDSEIREVGYGREGAMAMQIAAGMHADCSCCCSRGRKFLHYTSRRMINNNDSRVEIGVGPKGERGQDAVS